MIFLFITFKFPKNQLKEDGVMIFCYIIELNIIGWIIIDILYMLKKISKDCGYKSVSYTHLDVYKRQCYGRIGKTTKRRSLS